jgi:predicted transcriptional regulator
MRGRKAAQLSELQLDIMRTLWTTGEATTAQVHERMGKPRSLAYTTVATLLHRLEKQGLLRSSKDGRERVFAPAITEDEVTHRMVTDFVGKLFGGDPQALMSHLVRSSEFDEGDLQAVSEMLAEARNSPAAKAQPDAKPRRSKR